MTIPKKIKVELWDMQIFVGLIIEYPTNIVWTNQVGGTACQHPEIEGIYLPLSQQLSESDLNLILNDVWPGTISEEHYKKLQYYFEDYCDVLELKKDPRDAESWLHIKIKDGPIKRPEHLKEFAGYNAILTWSNCD